MTQLGIVKRNIERADKGAVEKLAQFGVATIHEAMGRVGLMKPTIRPVFAGARLCGTAVTVLLQPGDNWMMHVAAEQIQPGDVVVAACTVENTDGFFGDLLATSLKAGQRLVSRDGDLWRWDGFVAAAIRASSTSSPSRTPSRDRARAATCVDPPPSLDSPRLALRSREAMAAARASPLGPFTVLNLETPETADTMRSVSGLGIDPIYPIYQALVGGKVAFPSRP